MLGYLGRAICAILSLAQIPTVTVARPSVRSGSAPAAFAAIALPIQHTRFDARWTRVFSSRLPASAVSERASRLHGMERLHSVNTAVNEVITYREDRAGGRASDYWSNASDTLARRSGDCEDFAIAKMQLLMSAGIRPTEVFLVIGNDTTLHSVHALLLVREEGQLWVLDNLSNRILPANDYSDFRPILSFGSKGTWIYGYRIGTVSRDAYRTQALITGLGSRSALEAILAAQRR